LYVITAIGKNTKIIKVLVGGVGILNCVEAWIELESSKEIRCIPGQSIVKYFKLKFKIYIGKVICI
jgi:hypothetical protein